MFRWKIISFSKFYAVSYLSIVFSSRLPPEPPAGTCSTSTVCMHTISVSSAYTNPQCICGFSGGLSLFLCVCSGQGNIWFST